MDTVDQAVDGGQASVGKRRLRTSEEKLAILEEATAPGASVAAVARKYGVNANLVFGWRRLHKSGLLERNREPAALVPVQVATPTVLPDRASREVAPVVVEPVPRRCSHRSQSHIEVLLPSGVMVRVHGRVDREVLAAVVAALRTR
jgi:transposase